jgi:hypothetical protein
VKNRLIEERRDRLSRSIKEAREEYRQGKAKRGSVEDLMRDLTSGLATLGFF